MEKIYKLIDHIKIIESEEQESDFLDELYTKSRAHTLRLAFVNAHALNLCYENEEFLDNLLACDYVLRDGSGMRILYRLLNKKSGMNMNGTDFIPKILARYRGDNIALLGTSSPYLERAAQKMEDGGVHVIAKMDGFQAETEYVDIIKDKHVNLVLLSMGMPKQERMSHALSNASQNPALIVCGGAIADFMANRFPRAPMYLQKIGMEWAYRLSKEPARLFRRYAIGNFVFLFRALYMALWSKKTASSPPKILHVVRQFAPSIGGMESYVESLIEQQRRMGYDCEVLTLNKVFHGNYGTLPADEVLGGTVVKRVSFLGVRQFFLPVVSPLYFRNFDLVHVHNTDVFYDYVALCSRIFCFPAVATTHGGFFHTKNFSGIKSLYFNTITRLSTVMYSAVIAISQQDMDKFKTLRRDISYLPNAIEPLAHQVSLGQDFLFIGRLSDNKNVPDVIRVFATLKQKSNISAKLRIVGPEWDVKISDLEGLATSLNIHDDVIFHGAMSREGMKDVLNKCGYFVSASGFEGFGMSMLEGMTGGLVPFVQANNSFQELITKCGCGLLLDYKNVDQSVQEIMEYLPKVDLPMREHCRDFALSYSWPKLAEDIDAIYRGKVLA